MPKKTSSAAGVPVCLYECQQGQWINIGGNPPAGYYCPSNAGTCSLDGDSTTFPPEPIPFSSAVLASNTGEYYFNRKDKSLYFRGGNCGKGKHFKPVITLKELAKIDPDAAELIKSMQKNKKITSFSVVLKSQKNELA